MQALSERIDEWLRDATFEGFDPLGFTGLKTAVPSPTELVGHKIVRVDRRAKYVILHFDTSPELRVAFHLSQAGRVDFEHPPKKTKPKGSVVRWRFSDDRAVLVREFGTERTLAMAFTSASRSIVIKRSEEMLEWPMVKRS